MRRFEIGKYGLKENPVGHHVTWRIGEREFLAVVEGVRRCETRSATLLQTRFPNGDQGPEVSITAVMVLERESSK
jgi:hypothetical protein